MRTPLADVRTLLAVLHAMLPTLFAACVADLGAKPTNWSKKVRTASHVADSQPTHLGAVAVESNAFCHLGNISFGQARLVAMIAGLSTLRTRVNARLIVVFHDRFQSRNWQTTFHQVAQLHNLKYKQLMFRALSCRAKRLESPTSGPLAPASLAETG